MTLPWILGGALLLISLWVPPIATDLIDGGAASGEDGRAMTFIVRTRNDMKPATFENTEQWYASTVRTVSRDLDAPGVEDETAHPNGGFVHVYRTVFHGFAARLTQQQAEQLRAVPGIIGIFPDRVLHLQTTRTPRFLGLRAARPGPLLEESDFGSDVIIGVLDSGIEPESRSFNDEGLGPIPARWKGECVEGEKFSKSLCNRKLIGARFFTGGYRATVDGSKSTEVQSARDKEGHGTHTASTAAGRMIRNASFFGFAAGDAIGIAPKARIAVYKVCWKDGGCRDSDILAAFDAAVDDGVDVISLSVGGSSVPYHMDPIAIGSFAAMEKGVIVSASAGNDGPDPKTLSNVAPWITTVGASTIDRSFSADLVLGDGTVLTGDALNVGHLLPKDTYFPLYYAGHDTVSSGGAGPSASTCQPDSLDPVKVNGKIVVCDRGGGSRVAKGAAVRSVGGVGVVVANVAPMGEGLTADAHLIPGLDITESAGDAVKRYIASVQSPRATIRFHGTQLNTKPAPVLASFSARGPNPESLYVLKPDVIAPGVNILAAWPNGLSPSGILSDTRTAEFNILSGTSMSCPHVSGIAALLRGAHPDWSPAMIRSALMTTASSRDHRRRLLLDSKAFGVSTVWGVGAGHVEPERAADPGLVYDLTATDYRNYLCSANYSDNTLRVITGGAVTCPSMPGKESDLNYPAISIVLDAAGRVNSWETATRTATHVSEGAANYTVTISHPKGAVVRVEPRRLAFGKKGDKQSYTVKVVARKRNPAAGDLVTRSGSLTWSDAKHYVTSPILVVWQSLAPTAAH